MYGNVSDITPSFFLIGKTSYASSGKLYNSHTLYNKHQLYYGALVADGSPMVGSIEDKSPTLYSVVNE
jgi:hypothetical protein